MLRKLYLSETGLRNFFAQVTRNFNVLIEKNRRNTVYVFRGFSTEEH